MDVLGVIAFGLAGGLVGGLLGVGGGILFVPGLAIFLERSQLDAEATSLLAIVLVAALGATRQHGYGNVRPRDALAIALLSPLGVAIGVITANNVPQRVLELGFAGLLLLVASRLVARARGAEA